MTAAQPVPDKVLALIAESAVAEFATVSAAGLPIDTPTFLFPSDDLATFDVATGLAYPAKAERARRDPRVGMSVRGDRGDPVVLVRGRAAVRDADLAANAVRYLSETSMQGPAAGVAWAKARAAVWYWTRVIVEVSPERILWWDRPDAMNGPPHVWDAPPDAAHPISDPAPTGRAHPPPPWDAPPWRELVAASVARPGSPHVTVRDADGYPLPLPTLSCEPDDNGFSLRIGRGVGWAGAGPGTLTYAGMETYVGGVRLDRDGTGRIDVERALPRHPLMQNPAEVVAPTPEVRETLCARLRHEARRRGQEIPATPAELPAPTRLALRRQARYDDVNRP